jgi:TolB-like protein
VKTKLALDYEELGAQAVKNIAEPVRVYRIHLEPRTAAPAVRQLKRRLATSWRQVALGVLGLVLILGGGVAVWHLAFRQPAPAGGLTAEKAATLPLPDKPSIAVLPFVNMSGDPEQEYFSDGMTEDLITDLSKLSGLFVIARNSVFTYKGKAVKPEQVSRELGVRYVLEGSVRKAGDRVRITAQLVEATTAYHLWAERYDRPLQEIFALQDEIRQKIVTALRVQLTQEEQARFRRFPTHNLEAYDALLRGLEHAYRFTQAANAQARQLFESAIALDSQYAAAYAFLGLTHLHEWVFLWSQDSQTLEQAFALAQKAVALNDSLPVAHRVLGSVYVWHKQHDQAIAEAERAIALDPNDAQGYATLARILEHAGRPQEAFGLVEKAIRLDPQQQADYAVTLGEAYYLTEQYEEAITAFKRALMRYPNLLAAHALLAASYSELDREEEARAAMAEVLRLSPQASFEGAKRTNPYKDQAVFERRQAAQTVAMPPPGVVLAKPTGPPIPSQAVGPLVIHAGQVIDSTGRAPLER